jgi:UDP-N-acetylglucosamine 2-epimerase (non-hydrolysing)
MPYPTIAHVVGARPNFMKASPVLEALGGSVEQSLVHTGQHYDRNMSKVFFEELELPLPTVNLDVGSASHSLQTAEIMKRFDAWCQDDPHDLVVVYGDVNSTVAAALVCAKRRIPVAHVEAGLRSFDRSMPEEVNRVVTDQISDLLFTPSSDADENLKREGVPSHRIHLVGNVMIDTLVRLMPRAEERWERQWVGRVPERYGLVTLHRPTNVDDPVNLQSIKNSLEDIATEVPVLFPVHPRTRGGLERLGALRSVTLLEPLAYLDFLALQSRAAFVITDSGGIQEETTYLRVPCLTLRANTERPVTVEKGSNTVVGTDPSRLLPHVRDILDRGGTGGSIPALWDGKAAHRIAEILAK